MRWAGINRTPSRALASTAADSTAWPCFGRDLKPSSRNWTSLIAAVNERTYLTVCTLGIVGIVYQDRAGRCAYTEIGVGLERIGISDTTTLDVNFTNLSTHRFR